MTVSPEAVEAPLARWRAEPAPTKDRAAPPPRAEAAPAAAPAEPPAVEPEAEPATPDAGDRAGASPEGAGVTDARTTDAPTTDAAADEAGSSATDGPDAADVRGVAPVPPPRPTAPRREPEPRRPRVRPSVAASLLDAGGGYRAMARRAAVGAGLSAAYGIALGAREGGLALLTHALGVPAALVAVALLGLPALYIVLALFDAPLSIERAGGAAARGIASAGLVLAGLAPLAALYVVTSSSEDAAATAATLGLAVGGLLGLRHLVTTLRDALGEADSATRFVAGLSQLGFSLFAALLAWRVWGALLPLVGGA